MQSILAVYPSNRTTRLTSDANDSVNGKRHAAPLLAGYFFPMELDVNGPCAHAKNWTMFPG